MKNINLVLKRLLDIIGSLLGGIVIFPVLIAIALMIKMTSEGPVLFKQERLGKKGKRFQILKFRTMIVNAENIGDCLSIKSEKDTRITRIGRVLRATSLDELPQLFNVLIGQMSLVGPRPPVTYCPYQGYVNYPDWAKKRFLMRPGMTGLTQITVRNSLGWDERIKIDNEYIDHFTIWFDIKILFKTVEKVLKRNNIYTEFK